MSDPRILFLPDFAAAIGGGHVMRCLTLAEALVRRGATCGFAAAPEAAKIIKTFSAAPIDIVEPDWAAAVAVIDGYDYGIKDERALSAQGRRVCAFDDILRPHDCDLLVDIGFGRKAADYPGRAKVLVGPAYAPVRPEFAAARVKALARRDGRPVERVLVSLGLTDVGGITQRVVTLLRGLPGWTSLDVVLGDGAESLPRLQSFAEQDSRVTLHVNTRDMAGLLSQADLGIGAGGGSTFERACLGLPTLHIILADNQRKTALELDSAGAVLALDATFPNFNGAFEETFMRLVQEAEMRCGLSERSMALCDGLGAERLADAVLALA